jgi:hypothetical protein
LLSLFVGAVCKMRSWGHLFLIAPIFIGTLHLRQTPLCLLHMQFLPNATSHAAQRDVRFYAPTPLCSSRNC